MRIVMKSWNNGTPFIGIKFESTSSLVAFKQRLRKFYGKDVGNSCTSTLLRLCGSAAIKAFEITGQEVPEEFKGWKPKSDPFKLFKLSDAEIIADARRFTERNQWRRENKIYPHVHRHRRHLLPACTAHMVSPGGPFKEGYQVYAYEFSDHSAYIGLTCNPDRRHKDHPKKGPVAHKITEGKTYQFKVIAEGLMPTAAGKLEEATIQRYKAEDWTVSNKRHGGSTGQIRTKYTYNTLLGIARHAKTRKQFQLLDNGAYQYACNHKLLEQLAIKLGWPEHATNNKWTQEKCLQEASKFNRLSDWATGSAASYQAAWKRGWHGAIKQALFL